MLEPRARGRVALRHNETDGHKTEAVYRGYAITPPADLAEGVAVLHGAARDSPRVVPITNGAIRAQ